MCLLLLFHEQIPGYPLVLCANRDEYFDRPASPPRIWDPAAPGTPFLAPRDERAGGTWIGLNRSGAVAAITNRKGVAISADAPSRGDLCAEVLGKGPAEYGVRQGLEKAGQEAYNGFNLLIADRTGAWVLVGGGSQVRCIGLSAGVHVLTNEHDLDEVSLPEQDWWRTPPASEDGLLARLGDLLKAHDALSSDGFAPCKHFDNRGTRSASILLLSREGVRYLFADGPPCETSFDDLSEQAQALLDGEPDRTQG
jgi:hypothetical protein